MSFGNHLTKVAFHARTYAKMRRGIVVRPDPMRIDTLHELEGLDFVFLCMEGKGKRPIVEKLESLGIPFADVGMGIAINGHSACAAKSYYYAHVDQT